MLTPHETGFRAPGSCLGSVAVLCARRDSVYKTLPGVDTWDEDRNAWGFRGGSAVVGHPPCRLFGRMSATSRVCPDPKEQAQDICLGLWCARWVLECGGVLEQPAGSSLFSLAGLPSPGERGPGFTIEVPQYWWGHHSRKLTWFWFHGIRKADLPPLPFRLEGPDLRKVENVGGGKGNYHREYTPIDLATWLVDCARRSAGNRGAIAGLVQLSTSVTVS